jgi:hypothetical protein
MSLQTDVEEDAPHDVQQIDPRGQALPELEYDVGIKVVFLENKLNNLGKCSYAKFNDLVDPPTPMQKRTRRKYTIYPTVTTSVIAPFSPQILNLYVFT